MSKPNAVNVAVFPVVTIQEGRMGTEIDPDVLNASWVNQFVGWLWPDILSGRPPLLEVRLELQLVAEPPTTPRRVNQEVRVCEPPGENGVPSTWLADEAMLFAGVYQPGDIVSIPLPISPVMGETDWAVVIHAEQVGPDNLQAVATSVCLVAVYAASPEGETREYAYTILRSFKRGDSVKVNVVDGGRTVAEMRFVL